MLFCWLEALATSQANGQRTWLAAQLFFSFHALFIIELS